MITIQDLCINSKNYIEGLRMNYLGLVLLLGVAFIVPSYQFIKKKLRLIQCIEKFPGPRALPFFGNSLDFNVPRNQLFKVNNQMARKYNPIFRLWMGSDPIVQIIRPEHAEIILRSSVHIEKSSIYEFLHPWMGTGLITSTGNKWHSRRKLITPAFHFKILNVFFEIMSTNAALLVEKLRLKSDQEPFDIYPLINLCSLDIICETAMGVPINAQKNKETEYVKAVLEITELIFYRILSPWLWYDCIFKFTNVGKRFYKNLNVLHSFARKIIRERRQLFADEKNIQIFDEENIGRKTRLAFLDLLLQVSNEGIPLTDEEIREEVDTFMSAGHDTITTSMSWILYLLGSHPDHQKKVVEELDTIFKGSDRPITVKDLSDMKYLERVIKEGSRLFPSIPRIGRRLNQDLEIGNYKIPSGANVFFQIYHLHRCPDQFPDPETFNPDHFLPENIAKRHPYSYIPFSAGPRNCIGQKFALMEEKIILAQILRNFEIEAKEKLENMNLIVDIVLRPENGIILSLRQRTRKS